MVLHYSSPQEDHNTGQPPVLSESWSVSISEIDSNLGMRLDARHYNPVAANAVKKLRESGVKLRRLSGLAHLELPGQFTRIWAKDQEHGVPYLNATDLLSLMALGVPAGGPRYLSYATATDIEKLVIRKGTLLMTCSGTIGRVFYVPERLNGWAGTHDLVRIVPNETKMTGFLYAYLGTAAAQNQILSHTHGGQIDHVTAAQVANCLVPVPNDAQITKLNDEIMEGFRLRERAIKILTSSERLI